MINFKYLFTIIFVLFFALTISARASEISGFISTNPLNPSLPYDNVSLPGNTPGSSGGSEQVYVIESKQKIDISNPTNIKVSEEILEQISADEKSEAVIVLAMTYIANHTLVRASNKKIYLIEGVYKKPIHNLGELGKYRGQKIFEYADFELASYPDRNYLNGELIREKNSKDIFVLRDGKLKKIIGLSELRNKYFAKKINSLSREEMIIYKYS